MSTTPWQGNSVTTLKDVQTTNVFTLELKEKIPMDAMNLNVINEVKIKGRLLSDVAKDYGLTTKKVYQIVHQNEQKSNPKLFPIVQQTKSLGLRIKQLLRSH
ncbi:hypothetical protein [Shewanella pneumatophori]|uniref:Uncharacterized protein n=1 Tax=Shewanella pneumatophori TaxID=314092 RepID=A0A9X1ZBX1_9GAMM|nr:hypothetical protein [Shewanella pneumatophori]MCL1139439.1 hypothetical protein [Shewanella pneumatophori]